LLIQNRKIGVAERLVERSVSRSFWEKLADKSNEEAEGRRNRLSRSRCARCVTNAMASVGVGQRALPLWGRSSKIVTSYGDLPRNSIGTLFPESC